MSVKKLLNMPEGKTLEFKRDLSSPTPVLKTLTAFANTSGGTLILGIGDDGQIIGVNNPLALEERITSLIADNITPLLLPTIKMVTIKNKSLIIIEVPPVFHFGPYYLKQKGLEKGVMVRLGSSTRLATLDMIVELERGKTTQSFDVMPCLGTCREDLDDECLRETFDHAKKLISTAKLKTLNILVVYSGQLIPSNAGVLLFGKKAIRQKMFPMAYVSGSVI